MHIGSPSPLDIHHKLPTHSLVLHLPIRRVSSVGASSSLFLFLLLLPLLSTTCAASIIMINKFSLPIVFDFNLQWDALSTLYYPLFSLHSSFPRPADCLVHRDRFDRQLNAMGRFRSSSKKPSFSLLLFILLQWVYSFSAAVCYAT